MSSKILPLFYLPPISWFSEFLDAEKKIILESKENLPKQTYRNRAAIYGANGRLLLVIPVQHTGERCFSDIQIAYREDWQKLHWKSIKNVYQAAPFFEYYEDKLIKIYQKKEKYLLDFNLNALSIIKEILKISQDFTLSTSYQKMGDSNDFRSQFSSKTDTNYALEPYYQVFSDKFGFLEDLSIIDLICNKGPESVTYLKNNIHFKH